MLNVFLVVFPTRLVNPGIEWNPNLVVGNVMVNEVKFSVGENFQKNRAVVDNQEHDQSKL